MKVRIYVSSAACLLWLAYLRPAYSQTENCHVMADQGLWSAACQVEYSRQVWQVRPERETITQELERLQRLVIGDIYSFVRWAEKADKNLQERESWRPYPVIQPTGKSMTAPYLISYKYRDHDGDTREAEYLVVLIRACDDGIRIPNIPCHNKIIAKNLYYRDTPVRPELDSPPIVVSDKDLDAISSSEMFIYVPAQGILEVIQANEAKPRIFITEEQLIDILRSAEEAGRIRNQIKESKENHEKQVDILQKALGDIQDHVKYALY